MNVADTASCNKGMVQSVSYKKTDETEDHPSQGNDPEISGAEGGAEDHTEYCDSDLHPGDLIAFAWQVSRGMVRWRMFFNPYTLNSL